MVEYRYVLVLTLLPYVPDLASRELAASLQWSLLLVNRSTLLQDPVNQANHLLAIDLNWLLLLLRFVLHLISNFDHVGLCLDVQVLHHSRVVVEQEARYFGVLLEILVLQRRMASCTMFRNQHR